MNPVELIRAGRLTEARASLVQGVKASPGDMELRLLLFKVLAFLGEWDKAQLHLGVVAAQAPKAAEEISFYQDLIAAERHREEVRLHKRTPEFLTEPPSYLPEFLAAREELAKGNGDLLASLLPVLEPGLMTISGTAQGMPFEGLADLDVSLLPFLEVFVHDRYLWFPLPSLRELSVQPPTTLLDLLWSRARIVTWDGVTTDCVLPVVYPGSWSHPGDDFRMGRMTCWEGVGGYSRGIGQHVYLLGEEEKSLLELGEVIFNFPTTEQKP